MKITFLSVCLLAFLFTFSTQTFAIDFTVNLTTDQHDANIADSVCDIDLATAGEQCSLRAAVEQANNNLISITNDRVLFNLPANSTITLTVANGGEILLNGILEVIGTGANNLTIDGGAGTNRIFTIAGRVTIMGVTLTGGGGTGITSSGQGGAIYAMFAQLVLDSVHVTANSAGNGGGGAIYFFFGTNHRILNSTISANTTISSCGGIYIQGDGTLAVTNSTISGNSAGQSRPGGGFCINGGTVTFRSVTITGNTAELGGGIYYSDGTINLGNTIVAGNAGGTTPDISLFTAGLATSSLLRTSGYNLIGINTSVEVSFPAGNPNANNDIVGTSTSPINPLLGALQNNGGTTPTHALLQGSPAIDKGLNSNVVLLTDQRGFSRIVDGDGNGTAIVDIGAFEVQAPTAASVSVGGRVMTENGRGIRNVRLTLTDSNGEVRTATTTAFGYYRFDDVQAGETYILSAIGKRYTFSQPVQVLNINEATDAVNFIASEQSVFLVN